MNLMPPQVTAAGWKLKGRWPDEASLITLVADPWGLKMNVN